MVGLCNPENKKNEARRKRVAKPFTDSYCSICDNVFICFIVVDGVQYIDASSNLNEYKVLKFGLFLELTS
jgi:hypothetical protein